MADLLGDVARHAVDAIGHAGAIAHDVAAVVDPALAAVRAQHAVFDVERPAFGEHRAPGGEHRRPVVGMHHVDPQVAVGQEILRLAAEDFARGRADVDDVLARQLHRPEHVRQRIDDAREAAAHQFELDLDLATLAALLGFGERALDRRGQANQIGLEHVVGGAVLQRADRILLADGPRDEDERHLGAELAREAQRRHAVEARHREIRQDDVGRELARRQHESLLAVGDAVRDAQAGPLELAHLQLRVGRHVFREQHADRRCRLADHCGTRLVSTQYRPILATVSMNASN